MSSSRNVRKARKNHSVPGSHTRKEWEKLKKSYGGLCASCGQKKKLTKDHIIPISRPDLGATNYIWNIQPLCEECNTKKANSIRPMKVN